MSLLRAAAVTVGIVVLITGRTVEGANVRSKTSAGAQSLLELSHGLESLMEADVTLESSTGTHPHVPDVSLSSMIGGFAPQPAMERLTGAWTDAVAEYVRQLADHSGHGKELRDMARAHHARRGTHEHLSFIQVDEAAASRLSIEAENAQRMSRKVMSTVLHKIGSEPQKKAAAGKCANGDTMEGEEDESGKSSGSAWSGLANLLGKDDKVKQVSAESMEDAGDVARLEELRDSAKRVLKDMHDRGKQWRARLSATSKKGGDEDSAKTEAHAAVDDTVNEVEPVDTDGHIVGQEIVEIRAAIDGGNAKKALDLLKRMMERQRDHATKRLAEYAKAAQAAASASIGELSKQASTGKQVEEVKQSELVVELKELFAREFEQLKTNLASVGDLLKFLRIGLAWELPVTPAGILNAKLPGFSIVCQPIADCISHVSAAAKAVINMVWRLLTLPVRIIWTCIKHLLKRWGVSFGSKASLASQSVNENESTFTKKVAGEDDASLVPESEAQGVALSSCTKTCNLRLVFSFALGVMDVVLGFGITAFKVKLATLPGNAPTLLTCGKSCVRYAVQSIAGVGKREHIGEAYWKRTCSPHTVGMCMMIGRVTQCGKMWDTTFSSVGGFKEHPFADFTKFEMKSPLKGFCKMIPESARVVVKRSPGGMLTCPFDDVADLDAAPDRACGGAKNSCAVFSMKKACKWVKSAMEQAKKSRPDTCVWEGPGSENSPTWEYQQETNTLFEQCKQVFGCFDPFSQAAQQLAGAPAKPLKASRVREVIEKHMESMDFLKARTNALKTPQEASQALFEDLQSMLGNARLGQEERTAAEMACRHRWKLTVGDLWAHPMWSGRCFLIPHPPKSSDPDLVNNVLPFTVSTDHRDVKKTSFMSGMKLRITGKSSEIATSSSSLADWIPKAVKGTQYMDFHGAVVDPKPGQVINRALLLADMLGISTSNSETCSCECCKTQAAAYSSCRPAYVGVVKATEQKCTPQRCHDRFPERCLSPSQVKLRKGETHAVFQRSYDAGQPGMTEMNSKGSLTCKVAAQRAWKLLKNDPVEIGAATTRWKEAQSRYQKICKACDLRVAQAKEKAAREGLLAEHAVAEQLPGLFFLTMITPEQRSSEKYKGISFPTGAEDIVLEAQAGEPDIKLAEFVAEGDKVYIVLKLPRLYNEALVRSFTVVKIAGPANMILLPTKQPDSPGEKLLYPKDQMVGHSGLQVKIIIFPDETHVVQVEEEEILHPNELWEEPLASASPSASTSED